MPTYITLANFTDQGIHTIRDLPQRIENGKKAAQATGASVQYFLTYGLYDLVLITEAPDDDVMATLLLTVASGGNFKTITLKAFGERELKKIVQRMPGA